MEVSRHCWIFFFVLAHVIAPNFEAVENDFIQHFGNNNYYIEWSVAKRMLDFKAMARICDQMKIYRDITKAIYEVKINPDPDPDPKAILSQSTYTAAGMSSTAAGTSGAAAGTSSTAAGASSTAAGSSSQKPDPSKPPPNLNVGHTPVVLAFRNKNYISRNIDVLRCEIANTKNSSTGIRERLYITQGKTDKSYHLLIPQIENGKEVYYLDRHEFERPEPPPKVKLDKSMVRHTIWVPDV